MQMTFDQKWGTKILIATVLFVSVYMVSGYLPQQSQAVNVYGPDDFWRNYYEGLAGEQFEDAGFDDRGPAWDNIFGNTKKDNGKNLYLLVYKELKSGPADAAIANTAYYFGYTEDTTIDIIDGKLHEIVEFDASVAQYDVEHDLLTLQGAIDKYNAIYDYYDQQLAIETMSSELSTQVKLQEMFANGDTSDSGFDLIVDLQRIEYILFGGANESGYGTSGSGGMDLGSDAGSSSEESDDSEDVSDDDSGDGTAEDGEAAAAEADSEIPVSSDEPIDDKTICFEDNDLNQAFSDFIDIDDSPSDSSAKVKVSTGGDTGDTGGDTDGDTGDSGDSGGSGMGDASALSAPPAGDWSRALPCDSFICLEINFISGEDEPQYEETTNCIDCHFTYIAETLKEVTSHSLAPSKVPGNMMEDASCKEASVKIFPSIKVFAISSPILTPSNDNIIVDVSGTWESFMDALKPNRKEEEEEYDPEDPTNYLSRSDYASMWALNAKGDTVTSVELTDEIITQTLADFDARIEMANELTLTAQMTDMTTMFQSLQYEMDAMNSIFSSILMSFSADLEYLSTIKDKPYQE